jgi:hypothetical protein
MMTGMDVDRALVVGNGLCDHDHPIPRRLHMRSRASRRTVGMDKGRSMGAACCWPSIGGSYLLSGFLANVQETDLSAISDNKTCGKSRQWKKGEGARPINKIIKSHHKPKIERTKSVLALESE